MGICEGEYNGIKVSVHYEKMFNDAEDKINDLNQKLDDSKQATEIYRKAFNRVVGERETAKTSIRNMNNRLKDSVSAIDMYIKENQWLKAEVNRLALRESALDNDIDKLRKENINLKWEKMSRQVDHNLEVECLKVDIRSWRRMAVFYKNR